MKNKTILILLSFCFTVLSQNIKKPHPITAAARTQLGTTVTYDPAYRKLNYPNGDVPVKTGVCTDVIIRALRKAYKMDLQKLVHEDMKRNFNVYPKIWGLKSTDKNIDHRRVPNLQTYFKRKGYSLKINDHDYEDGDIVTCLVGNRPHIMIVTNRKKADGVPLIIHNIGSGTKEEDFLTKHKITGHYRIKK